MDKTLLFIVNPRAGKTKSSAPLFDAVATFGRAGYLVRVMLTQAAGDAAHFAAQWGGDYDLVTFAPTNPGTQRRRGYNQAELLARAVAQRLALPCVPTLKKNRATQAMHGLTPAQRRDNVRDAYVLTVPGEVLLGKRVLLVDDILTTGATLSECGRALKAGGAAFVAGLCAASPRKGSAV